MTLNNFAIKNICFEVKNLQLEYRLKFYFFTIVFLYKTAFLVTFQIQNQIILFC